MENEESDKITVFSGWMFASSPADSLEHPVYDVTLLPVPMINTSLAVAVNCQFLRVCKHHSVVSETDLLGFQLIQTAADAHY